MLQSSSFFDMASLRLPDSQGLNIEVHRRSNGNNLFVTTMANERGNNILTHVKNELGDYFNNSLIELTVVSTRSAMEDSSTFINSSDIRNLSIDQVPDRLYRHSMAMSAVYCIAYIFVFVVGLIGNSFVIAVVYRSPRMRTVTNFFIVNLAVADVLVIVFCLPATLMSNIFVRKYANTCMNVFLQF